MVNTSISISNQDAARLYRARILTIALAMLAVMAAVAFAVWVDGYLHEVQYLTQPVDIQRAIESGGLRLGN